MPDSSLAFTAAERVALEAIGEEHPDLLAGLHAWLVAVLDDLARTSRAAS